MNITSHNPSIHYRGEDLTEFDAVIPRIVASVTFYGAAVLRQFEMMKVFSLNKLVAISRSRDKLRSTQLLARKGIEVASSKDIADLIIQFIEKRIEPLEISKDKSAVGTNTRTRTRGKG